MGYYNIIEPKLFGDFRCLGSDCPQNCCGRWGHIMWTSEEYANLASREMPEEMREKVRASFVEEQNPYLPEQKVFNIKLENSACPFLSANGLCSIQLKFGEDALSATCAVYPRVSVFNSAVLTRSCYSSCPEVLRILFTDKNALKVDIRTVQLRGNEVVFKAVSCEDERDFAENPALRFRNELFGLFYDILSNSEKSAEENLAIGSAAAKRLSEISADEIPAALQALFGQLESGNLRGEGAVLDEQEAEKLLQEILGENAQKQKSTDFSLPDFFFGNLALNLLFELKMPFYFAEQSISENFSLLCASFSLMKRFALSCGEEQLFTRLADFSRTIIHDKNTAHAILDFLKKT